MFKLKARSEPSGFWRIASPLLALVITVVLGVVLFWALGKDPVKGLGVFFWEPIKSPYALGELVVKATPLLLIARGLAVCFRSNVWNIGAEAQLYAGAIVAVLLGTGAVPSPFVLPVTAVFAMLAGALVLLGPALLKTRLGVDEVVTTLLFNFIMLFSIQNIIFISRQMLT